MFKARLAKAPNAAVQPQIRAQREFVGWNCLLGVTALAACTLCLDELANTGWHLAAITGLGMADVPADPLRHRGVLGHAMSPVPGRIHGSDSTTPSVTPNAVFSCAERQRGNRREAAASAGTHSCTSVSF